MSHAFVKEDDEQWLHDVAPTINALVNYLTRENNGVRIYEKSMTVDANTGKNVYHMSNGLGYSINEHGQWYIKDL